MYIYIYIYIMNFSNSLTCVYVFNVFPHPTLVPSKEFLGLFPLVLQQPRQRLELLRNLEAKRAEMKATLVATQSYHDKHVIRLEVLFHLRTPWMPGSVSQNWGPRNLWGSHKKCESFRRSSVPHVSDQILKTTSQTCWRRIWSIATLHRN